MFPPTTTTTSPAPLPCSWWTSTSLTILGGFRWWREEAAEAVASLPPSCGECTSGKRFGGTEGRPEERWLPSILFGLTWHSSSWFGAGRLSVQDLVNYIITAVCHGLDKQGSCKRMRHTCPCIACIFQHPLHGCLLRCLIRI